MEQLHKCVAIRHKPDGKNHPETAATESSGQKVDYGCCRDYCYASHFEVINPKTRSFFFAPKINKCNECLNKIYNIKL
jgi:hypothetical protein